MKIGDQCTFLQIPYHGDPYPADSRPLCNSLTLTSEAGEILSLLLEQLADFPSPQRGALLLSGDLGVDKSLLLRYLECLLANPEYPSWDALLQCLNLGKENHPQTPIRSLFIGMPPDLSTDLGVFFLNYFQHYASDPSLTAPANGVSPEALYAILQPIAARMASQSLGMIVLDNISERIEPLRDAERLQNELRFYRTLSEVFSKSGILTIWIGQEKHFYPEDLSVSLPAGIEKPKQNYSWIESANPPSFALPQSAPKREEEFYNLLQLQIYDWIQAKIPSWQPEHGPRYQHDSQALEANIPDGGSAAVGLVYFKSVFDPYWSEEDLARLKGTDYAWILMILNPCERFFEFEATIKAIGTHLPMLVIWRPDTPSRIELESLRQFTLKASTETEGASAEKETIADIRSVLANLYVRRGRLYIASDPIEVGSEIKNLDISQYLSACLNRLSSRKISTTIRGASLPFEAAHDSQVWDWAALITGDPKLRKKSREHAKERLMAWWITYGEELSRKLPDLPETFQTIRFWSAIKYIESTLQALKPVFQSLQAGTFSFLEAMNHIGRNFAWDQDRLLKWKQGLESLRELILWFPEFLSACRYLNSAFPMDRENLNSLRESLLRSIDQPHHFLEAEKRSEFSKGFADFKKNYRDVYCLLHEEALQVIGIPSRNEIKVDPVALHNLDLFTGLQYTDKSYLNRVKLLAKWIQRNQCNLPLHQILEHYPRCYCNFNPCSNLQPADSAAQISAIIQDGIDYFRKILRRCGYLILEDLKNQQIDDHNLKPITAALSDGPMIRLTPQSIQIINTIISKHPNEFLAEIRQSKQNRHIP